MILKTQVLWCFLWREQRRKVLWSVSLLPVFRYSLIIKENLMGQNYKLKRGGKGRFQRKERSSAMPVTYVFSNVVLLPADWLCFYATLTWIFQTEMVRCKLRALRGLPINSEQNDWKETKTTPNLLVQGGPLFIVFV